MERRACIAKTVSGGGSRTRHASGPWQASVDRTRASASSWPKLNLPSHAPFTRSRLDLSGNVAHHLGQFAGADLVEETVQLDVLRNSRALPQQPDIVVERLLEIHDGEA